MRSKVIAGSLVSLSFLTISQGASAFCFVSGNGGSILNLNMALNISSLTVPRDAPIGTMLHQQQFHQSGEGAAIMCRDANRTDAPPVNIFFNVIGLQANANFPASPFENKVYATGVPGIGVSWFNGWRYVDAARIEQPAGSNCPFSPGDNAFCVSQPLKLSNLTRLVLIKTGPVGSGTIRAADLGRLQFSLAIPGEPPRLTTEVGLTGAINVVSRTCTTPNVTVPLGSHRTSTFTGVGSASPRVQFVVNITDCPGFTGYYGSGIAQIPAASQSGVTNAGTRIPNSISYRMDPVYPAINATNGILSLTPGTGVATGIGVQISTAAGDIRALAQNRVLTDGNTLGFPLNFSARYVQTGSAVTAGRANAVMNYTFIYE